MLLFMRTTLDLDNQLFRQLKTLAAQSGRTFKEVIHEAIREALADRLSAKLPRKRIKLPVFRGDGLRPGVNLDSNAALFDLLDAADSRHQPVR